MSNLVSCELVREFVPNTPRIDSVKIKLIFITIYCQFFKMFLYIQHCFSIALPPEGTWQVFSSCKSKIRNMTGSIKHMVLLLWWQ